MIYIVEDDENIRTMEAYALTNSGYTVKEFASVAGFFEACAAAPPSLVLLDIMLPDMDGIEILKKMRKDPALQNIGVIMVTAKSREIDTVLALDQGADDYLSKPFGIMELLSRVKALERRLGGGSQPDILSIGDITLDDQKHLVTVNGEECTLTFKEYELLKYLIINKGIVLSRERLMESVWGFDFEGESRTVDVHIKTLRQKLGESGAYIKTVRNVGYKIDI